MSSTVGGRRLTGPEPPSGEIVVHAPPELEDVEGSSGTLTNVVPMLGGLGSVAAMMTMGSGTSTSQHRTVLAAAIFLGTTVAFVALQLDRQRVRRLRRAERARTSYLRHLGAVRSSARRAAAQQREATLWRHPPPGALPALAAERSRVWERSITDADFLQVRYGVCTQPLSVELVAPDPSPSGRADPAAADALRRLLAVHRVQPDLPASVDLQELDRIEICGAEDGARSLVRAMICYAAAFHSPEHLAIAVLASDDTLAGWDWAKWLPHAHSARCTDAVGPRRMVSTDAAVLRSLLPPGLAERPAVHTDKGPSLPHLLLVVDVGLQPAGEDALLGGLRGVTLLLVTDRAEERPDNPALRLLVDDRPSRAGARLSIRVARPGSTSTQAAGDCCDVGTAEALARRLAPLRVTSAGVGEDRGAGRRRTSSDLLDLLDLDDVRRFDAAAPWGVRPARDRLRVPIGWAEGGEPVHLDLKESAQHGMGPHGLVVGATGSGKSELLRTLVLGLALTHSPEQLNMVLVDFKGGATFAGMAAMPHVSALITNLADELPLVDRMQDALAGEMMRRQELLRAAGSRASVADYERARAAGADLVALPSLLIVVDEFSEMLSAKPEFLDLFMAIGRLGRSLGLHLLLASQRLDEGRLRGLESHLSYRVCLRTFSAQESRTLLGVPDAYELPPIPGLGFLRTDPSTLERFEAAYVSGPCAPPRQPVTCEPAGRKPLILPWTITEVRMPPLPAPDSTGPTSAEQESLLAAAVRQMDGHGPPAHQVWLPPLDRSDTLDTLMPDLTADPGLGLVSKQWRTFGFLTVPIGSVDRPRHQRRDVLTVALTGSTGHLAVVGGPRSGKSTLLRTLVASLSLTTTPVEGQFFVLDFGGGAFSALRSLPHVAGTATRGEPEIVRRIVAEVSTVVDAREAHFRAAGVDSIESYRAGRAQGRTDDGYGDVFLVVDGWSTLRADFDDLEVELQLLAGRGLTFGFHLLTASARWADFRAAVRDLFGTRLELRLGDPGESEIDRTLAHLVPPDRPGRGLVSERLHVLTALPRIDGAPEAGSLGEGLADLVMRVSQAWRGPPGPKLRLLPERLTVADLLDRVDDKPPGGPLLLGVDEKRLAPVGLDVDAEPCWLVFGDGRSGKTAALRAYVHEVMRTRTSHQAQLVVVDYRRSLLGEVPDDYLLDHLTSAGRAGPALTELAGCLEGRMPGHGVTPEQLRDRSWWTGPEVFVVVDDYDLVATSHSSPVQVLQPFLGHAHDVGLHLAVARRAAGASRALYEPVIQALRDLGAPGLVLSGSPTEGALVGTVHPTPAQAGRGRLVTRDRGVEVVQVAWRDPAP